MRPTATVALILAVGLVAAACGGDDATPKPEDPTAAPAAIEATEAPADETTEAPVDDATEAPAELTEAPAEPTPEPEPEFAKKAALTSEDDPETTFGLISGRYRFAWETQAAESDGCERVEIAVVQQDGDFEYVKPSISARFNATVNDLPEGTYKLEQRDPTCEIWQLRIDWMTN